MLALVYDLLRRVTDLEAATAPVMIAGGVAIDAEAAVASYMSPSAASGSQNEDLVAVPAPKAGTLRNLRVVASAAPGVGKNVVYAVRKNKANTAVTVTVANGISGSDLVNSVAVAAGDLIAVSITPDAGSVTAGHGFSLQLA